MPGNIQPSIAMAVDPDVFGLKAQRPGEECGAAQSLGQKGSAIIFLKDTIDPVIERDGVVIDEGDDIALG